MPGTLLRSNRKYLTELGVYMAIPFATPTRVMVPSDEI